jgi:hypothetical protein
MVTAGKVFKMREKTSIQSLAAKLKGLKKEEVFKDGVHRFNLLTEVRDLSLKDNALRGTFSWDVVTYIFHRGERVPTPKTIEASFSLAENKDRLLATIIQKKPLANNIANQLSETLFITTGHIVEAKILPEVLKSFHEQNPEDTKIIFFDEVDIPNINKLSLYGSVLMNTALYNDYCDHGKIWYIVFTSKKYGNIVGLTRNAVVTIFNRIGDAEFLSYVTDEVFPLIE